MLICSAKTAAKMVCQLKNLVLYRCTCPQTHRKFPRLQEQSFPSRKLLDQQQSHGSPVSIGACQLVCHLNDAIRKHAQSYQGDWQSSAYWICTFRNSQWHVKDELGNGQWQDSSFYLALRSPECKGTTMIIDELVQPLRRIWCLFEVYETICLSRSGCSQGLLLCTSTGRGFPNNSVPLLGVPRYPRHKD